MLHMYHVQLRVLIIKLEGTINTASGTTQLSQIHLNILQATEAIIKELTVEVLKVCKNDCVRVEFKSAYSVS